MNTPETFFSRMAGGSLPINWNDFFVTTFEKNFRFYKQILTASSGQDLLDTTALLNAYEWAPSKSIEIVREGQPWLGDPQDLRTAYENGFTIIADNVGDREGLKIRYFVHKLASELAMPIKINAFLTPRSNTGFPWHYDARDVLILQLEGSKTWLIGDCLQQLPMKGSQVEAPVRFQEVKLTAGDVFYLPSGWPHRASASQAAHSLHLTVNLLPPRRLDLLQQELTRLSDHDVSLRESVIYNNALSPISLCADNQIVQVALNDAYADLVHNWVCRLPRLQSFHKVDSATLDSRTKVCRRVENLSFASVTSQYCRVSFGGMGTVRDDSLTFKLPAAYAPAVYMLFRSFQPFSPDDLPGLSNEDQVAFVSDLMKLNVLQRVVE